jgi:hypothetical protein
VLGIFPSLSQSEACQTPIPQTAQHSGGEGEWLYSIAVPSYLSETNEHNKLLNFEVTIKVTALKVLTAFAIHL